MLRKTICVAVAASVAMLLTTSQVQAWGAAHVGYTHVGAGGVQHYGRTAAVGPHGAYSGSHYGAYGAGGASYHSGSAAGVHYGAGGASAGAYHYGGTSSYGAYHAGGVGASSVHYGSYNSGVYRRY